MKNITQNNTPIFESTQIGVGGVMSFSIINLPSIILLGIIILSLLGILVTILG